MFIVDHFKIHVDEHWIKNNRQLNLKTKQIKDNRQLNLKKTKIEDSKPNSWQWKNKLGLQVTKS